MNHMLSIVMPVFNRESFVGSAIESYQQQTVIDWEMVIIDDCSTDNSLEVCRGYAKNDDRIKIHQLPQNSGVGSARATGNDKASNDIVVIADSDDIAFPDRLEKISNYFNNNPETDVFYTNVDILNSVTNEIKPRFFQPYIKELLYHINYIPNPAAAYKKSAYLETNGYNHKLKLGEDYDLWLQFSDRNFIFGFDPVSTVQMTYHPQSVRIEKQSEHKDFINQIRASHGNSTPDLQVVQRLANSNTADFFLTEEKRALWFN